MDFSDEIQDEILKIFQIEAEEIISKLNNSLLELEKNPNNKDAILVLFRDAHTLKGASRMVGFDNVQLIAHKMEDILGLAKENKIALNSNIVDTLYKSVDFLSETIQKSVDKGQEVYLEDISKHISMLESAEQSASSTSNSDEEDDFDAEQLKKDIHEINGLISEGLFILMKIEKEKSGSSIQELLTVINNLYTLFKRTGPYDIKKIIEDLKVKLEFTTKASNSLTTSETERIHQVIDNIIARLISICGIYNLELVDYYELAFEKASMNPTLQTNDKEPNIVNEEQINAVEPLLAQEIIIEPEPMQSVPQTPQLSEIRNLSEIQNKIMSLSQGGGSFHALKDFILDYEKNCTNDKIKSVLLKISEILSINEKNGVKLDEETTAVILSSIAHCDNIINGAIETTDNELILQQLEIVKQVIELKNQKDSKYNQAVKSKYKFKTKKSSEISDLLNNGEIKTLRVDSSKLDNLVNQINELTITKIKTKKHLIELNTIKDSLQDWQSNSIKILNYLKYYDKRYLQSISADNPVSFFIKQLLNLHTDNNKKVQDSINKIANLRRTVQENDAKMSLAVNNLDQMIKDVRVLPFSTVFNMFGRMVRDIAQEKNKQIELEILGSETSTDKKIIEEIKAPLIHIIRNSIDHGIETPEERIALGKNPMGKIILSAHQVNNKILIEIKDDGKGINLEKIKNKALQKGYLTQEELSSMNDEQITNIIFSPGFSTGEEITNISGRGIGLDVVQTKISQLNGKVKILSQVNKGCCVHIELPTSMSTMKAFILESSNQIFAIPMDVINMVIRKKRDEIFLNKGKYSIIHKEKNIPLYHLSDILRLEKTAATKEKETILIMENGTQTMALCVDQLFGDQEILHKKLSAPFYKLKNISGITTLISGETCLILNVSDILNTANLLKTSISQKKMEQIAQNPTFSILLVDDSITTRTLEKNILTKGGYEVEIAENPIQAFEKMKHQRFDLIISDIEMPEMDGFSFLEQIKSDEMFFDIPIIMMSSLMNEDTKRQIMELGATKYIIKNDFDQESFLETIDDILHNKSLSN